MAKIINWEKTGVCIDGYRVGERIGYHNLPRGLDRTKYKPIYDVQDTLTDILIRLDKIDDICTKKSNHIDSSSIDPYQPDWSIAPTWATIHTFDENGTGCWFGVELGVKIWDTIADESGFTLPARLDWKKSKRRRIN
jgi:hypothetical protein